MKLLGIAVNKDLKFDRHNVNLRSKANENLRALSRVSKIKFFSIKEGNFSKFLWSLSLHILQLFRYFVVDLPATKLIDYIK